MQLEYALKVNEKDYYIGTASYTVRLPELVRAKLLETREEAEKITQHLLKDISIKCVEIVEVYTN